MSRTLSIDDSTRLAGRALDAMLAIASITPTRSIGDELRRSIATTARRVVFEAAVRSEARRRAERRRRIRRAIVAGVVLAAVVAARHRSSTEDAE
jgi:hypothetical protein